ncbi:MAG: hypothetical protein L6V95_10000 [Candidatus Melainabacteria bacterium]|nr:MAG: hypothetical protein L6V95_10000 [Candidatus Melainabacteria bacterium]
MTIEENLEKIANSLEKLVKVQEAMICMANRTKSEYSPSVEQAKEEPKRKQQKNRQLKK